jgi:NifB/MoaA-like Fe-S oxidoreductase
MHKINDIVKNSPAFKSGIKKGDYLISINNNKIEDILDYLYLTSDDKLSVKIMTSDGKEKNIKIKNNYNNPLGIEFENPTINEMRSCRNKCVFCFIDQLPKDMRTTLYYKDDDYRLCFLRQLQTLTNADIKIARIAKLRLSPVNIIGASLLIPSLAYKNA